MAARVRLAPHAIRLVHSRFHQDDLFNVMMSDQIDQAVWIAELLANQVQLKAAKQMYERVLAEVERKLGPEHTSTLGMVHNLGLLYANQD